MIFLRINGPITKADWDANKQRFYNFVQSPLDNEYCILVSSKYSKQNAWLFDFLKELGFKVRVGNVEFCRSSRKEGKARALYYLNKLRGRSEVETQFKVLAYDFPLTGQIFV